MCVCVCVCVCVCAYVHVYLTAMRDLFRNNDIIIKPSDKSGGLIIVDSTDFNKKMTE